MSAQFPIHGGDAEEEEQQQKPPGAPGPLGGWAESGCVPPRHLLPLSLPGVAGIAWDRKGQSLPAPMSPTPPSPASTCRPRRDSPIPLSFHEGQSSVSRRAGAQEQVLGGRVESGAFDTRRRFRRRSPPGDLWVCCP